MNITQHLTEVEERYAQRAKELIQNMGDKTIVLFMQYFITESKKFIVEEITTALKIQAEMIKKENFVNGDTTNLLNAIKRNPEIFIGVILVNPTQQKKENILRLTVQKQEGNLYVQMGTSY